MPKIRGDYSVLEMFAGKTVERLWYDHQNLTLNIVFTNETHIAVYSEDGGFACALTFLIL